jgi:hypothetical protein
MVSSGVLQEPHGVTTQKTPFFNCNIVYTWIISLYYIISNEKLQVENWNHGIEEK